ncbi:MULTISPECIES: NACHT domain-containing protein [Nostoc]|uniref:NACHT domain-containing protein n=2 Tax=Nostoc TaxID=1177 RepID=A0ABR8I629_9NOSO|nr:MULTISPECIES: NACHT domain-containing protein [Nostoc]MBD2561012.1 NACHT domain-containing protein [Nostoc linckia FACHB-391]MBD2646173.1 NACHT domain-containing protein [Nostoc foliaceum FACHB-393]
MSLPRDFLTQLEQYSELSNREKAVFLEIFSSGKSRVQVTQALNISNSNLNSFLTGIYKKFSISGSGPVKESRLREYLQKRYSQQKPSGSSTADIAEDDIDALVQEIREKIKPSIKEKCGTMRVLDMDQPIELTGERGIYTNVNILEKTTKRRRVKIGQLLQKFDREDFDHFGLHEPSEKRVSGLQAVQHHKKLMVLGKPGAGKTTFLKYLAMHCIEGQFLTNLVPVFIILKDFAQDPKQLDILQYITQQLFICGIHNSSVKTEQMLRQGKFLVLLDGLDEVREEDTKRILWQTRKISEEFHTNQFVITCRIAAKEYTFEQFTEVEVADFDKEQIAIFAHNWFRLNCQVKAERFIEKLQANKRIFDLATNPLLLTLLCLVFEENEDFPANRSELYKEGLDILLKKWDAKRNIERNQIYQNLSLVCKEDLLSEIAFTTFEQKDYFFKQKTVEAYIVKFLSNLQFPNLEPEVLKLDSEAVLKSIEAQHGLLVERSKGIYSFSHLTFQEYFCARKIVATLAYKNLVHHRNEKRWQEVFLLTVGVMEYPDNLVLLMKRKIDNLAASDGKIQHFLEWLDCKSSSFESFYKPAAMRALYFEMTLDNEQNKLDNTLEWDSENTLSGLDNALGLDSEDTLDDIEIDWLLNHALTNALVLTDDLANAFFQGLDATDILDETIDKLSRGQALVARDDAWCNIADIDDFLINAIDLTSYFQSELKTALQLLRDKLNEAISEWENLFEKLEEFGEWWEKNSQAWTKQLIALMIEHRNIGHNWQFSYRQAKLLRQYYNSNKLLVNCLNSDCNISEKIRQEIEHSLLLPISKLETENNK